MKSLLIKYKEILLYLTFGMATTLVNIVAYALCTKILSINWQISNIVAWILAVLFAYITNRKYVFESKNSNIFGEIVSFFWFRFLSFILDMGFMYLLVDMIKMDDIVAKIIVQIIVIVMNYVFSKLFIFKKKHYKK